MPHTPIRSCIVCRRKGAPGEFLRWARVEGRAVLAQRGGRGAYVCLSEECASQLVFKGRLDRALRLSLSPEQRARALEETRCRLR